MIRIVKLSGVLLLVLMAAACTQVKPWERGELAKQEMAFDVDPMETQIKNHIYFSKEGSSSGSAVTGGGCGCN